MRTAADIEQDAATWVIKVDEDRSPEASRALANWLDEHPRHRASFIRISMAWRRADVLRKIATRDGPVDPDFLLTWEPP